METSVVSSTPASHLLTKPPVRSSLDLNNPDVLDALWKELDMPTMNIEDLVEPPQYLNQEFHINENLQQQQQTKLTELPPTKKKRGPGRINAPRATNGRFVMVTTQPILHRVSKKAMATKQMLRSSDKPDVIANHFIFPTSEEIALDLINMFINESKSSLSPLHNRIRFNMYIKYLKPQLIAHIETLLASSKDRTYKALDEIIISCLNFICT